MFAGVMNSERWSRRKSKDEWKPACMCVFIYTLKYIYTINNKYVLKYTSILSWNTCDRTTVVETYFDWFLKRGERSDSVWISNEIKMCSCEYNWRSVVQVIAKRWIPYLLYKPLIKLILLTAHSSSECEAGKVKCHHTFSRNASIAIFLWFMNL